MNGLNGQLTQRSLTPPPDAPATGTTIWSERIAAGGVADRAEPERRHCAGRGS